MRVSVSQVITATFFVFSPSTSALINADSTPTALLKKNGTTDGAVTVTISAISTGEYTAQFTVPSGYAVGDYIEVIATKVVSSITAKEVIFRGIVDTTISSRSSLDATGVRTAVGLASANLDTQLTTIDDFLDTEIAAIKAKTDLIPDSPAAVGSAMTLADGAITAAKVADSAITAAKLADGAITAAKIADSAITAAKVATGAIDADAIASDAVTEITTAVQANTSLVDLAAMISGDGTAGAKFTTTALENAPSGGGGGGSSSLVLLRGLTLQIDANEPGEALRLMQGSDLSLLVTLLDGSSDPINLASFTVTAQIRAADGTVALSPTVTVESEATGQVSLAIPDTFTDTAQRDLTLTVKLDGGTGNVHVTYPTEVEVRAR